MEEKARLKRRHFRATTYKWTDVNLRELRGSLLPVILKSMNSPCTAGFFLLLSAFAAEAAFFGSASAKDPSKLSYQKDVLPLLRKYCYDCHSDGIKKGGVEFDSHKSHADLLADRKLWNQTLLNVRSRVMPPEDRKKQPTLNEREVIQAWIDFEVFKADPKNPDPGRVTIRRLNRTEYNNTIRDLVGVNFRPADDFPADDAGYGFDNIGDVLSMPPLLLEKYLTAADKILGQAIMVSPVSNARGTHLDPKLLAGPVETYVGATGNMRMFTKGSASMRFNTLKSGEHWFRVLAAERISGQETARMEVRVDGNVVKTASVNGTLESPTLVEFEARLNAGSHMLSFALLNPQDGPAGTGTKYSRGLAIEKIEFYDMSETTAPDRSKAQRIAARQFKGGNDTTNPDAPRRVSGTRPITAKFSVARAGEHRLRISTQTRYVAPETTRMEIRLDGKLTNTIEVRGDPDLAHVAELPVQLSAGTHELSLGLANPHTTPKDQRGRSQTRAFAVEWVEILEPKPNAVIRLLPDLLFVGYNAKQLGDGWVSLNSVEEDDVAFDFVAPRDGEYSLRTLAWAKSADSNAMVLTFQRDNQTLRQVKVEADETAPQHYEAKFRLPAGKHRLRVVVLRDKTGLSPERAAVWKSGKDQKGAVHVRHLEVEGPPEAAAEMLPETHRRIFFKRATKDTEPQVASEVIGAFAKRAYRRPVTAAEVARLVKVYDFARKNGESFEVGVAQSLKAVLVSPSFLFRGELQPEPDNPKSVHAVNEFALASRLSYFLWSSMPDTELFSLAERGQLRANLETQVRRMLKDPKSRALVENFAGQWLQLRNLAVLQPDRKLFPNYDAKLRTAMQRETELLFETVLREDRSVFEFLTADYTFVNERLAKHYGISGVSGEEFQRVSLKGMPRVGVLTHASILTLTSNPTRTSPVKRGKWVLENLLATPPPPPAPNVPELDDQKQLSGTLRQRMEQHRANPNCASCHTKMDAIGFGLENFDAVGVFRAVDGGAAIDPSGQLGSAENFQGPMELAKLLATKKHDDFLRCMVEKMLTYALGRGLEYYDRPAVLAIADGLVKRKHAFSSLVLELVTSVPFQKRRGEGDAHVAIR